MGDDPRLPEMPERPTLVDFFKYRFGPCMHLLQSARHAVKGGLSEKMVLSCLLHDISTIGFIVGGVGVAVAVEDAPEVPPVDAHDDIGLRLDGHRMVAVRRLPGDLLDQGPEVEEHPDYIGLGWVVRVSPSAGDEVPKGSTVTLVVI